MDKSGLFSLNPLPIKGLKKVLVVLSPAPWLTQPVSFKIYQGMNSISKDRPDRRKKRKQSPSKQNWEGRFCSGLDLRQSAQTQHQRLDEDVWVSPDEILAIRSHKLDWLLPRFYQTTQLLTSWGRSFRLQRVACIIPRSGGPSSETASIT